MDECHFGSCVIIKNLMLLGPKFSRFPPGMACVLQELLVGSLDGGASGDTACSKPGEWHRTLLNQWRKPKNQSCHNLLFPRRTWSEFRNSCCFPQKHMDQTPPGFNLDLFESNDPNAEPPACVKLVTQSDLGDWTFQAIPKKQFFPCLCKSLQPNIPLIQVLILGLITSFWWKLQLPPSPSCQIPTFSSWGLKCTTRRASAWRNTLQRSRRGGFKETREDNKPNNPLWQPEFIAVVNNGMIGCLIANFCVNCMLCHQSCIPATLDVAACENKKNNSHLVLIPFNSETGRPFSHRPSFAIGIIIS